LFVNVGERQTQQQATVLSLLLALLNLESADMRSVHKAQNTNRKNGHVARLSKSPASLNLTSAVYVLTKSRHWSACQIRTFTSVQLVLATWMMHEFLRQYKRNYRGVKHNNHGGYRNKM
jgi:hypothetical protein